MRKRMALFLIVFAFLFVFVFVGCQFVGQVKKSIREEFVLGAFEQFPVTVTISGFEPDRYNKAYGSLSRIRNKRTKICISYVGWYKLSKIKYWKPKIQNMFFSSMIKVYKKWFKNKQLPKYSLKKIGEVKLEAPEGKNIFMEKWFFKMGNIERKIALVYFNNGFKEGILAVYRINGRLKADPGDVVSLFGFSEMG